MELSDKVSIGVITFFLLFWVIIFGAYSIYDDNIGDSIEICDFEYDNETYYMYVDEDRPTYFIQWQTDGSKISYYGITLKTGWLRDYVDYEAVSDEDGNPTDIAKDIFIKTLDNRKAEIVLEKELELKRAELLKETIEYLKCK